MLQIILIMAAGIATGWLLRQRIPVKWLNPVLTVMVWALLFFLGVEVGMNEKVLASLQSLGLEALLLAVGASAGSIALAWALWKLIKRKEGGRLP